MAKVKRSLPRRSPNRYPVGTTLTFRDGRVFEVVGTTYKGMGPDPRDLHYYDYVVKSWKEVTHEQHTD